MDSGWTADWMVEPMGSGVSWVSLVDAIHAYSGVTLVVANGNGEGKKVHKLTSCTSQSNNDWTSLLCASQCFTCTCTCNSLPHQDTNLAYTATHHSSSIA